MVDEYVDGNGDVYNEDDSDARASVSEDDPRDRGVGERYKPRRSRVSEDDLMRRGAGGAAGAARRGDAFEFEHLVHNPKRRHR